MMRFYMNKLSSLFLVVILLNSCGGMSFTQDPSRYANTPPSQLCIDYYSALVTGNFHAAPRREMIEQRGIDCRPYKEEGIMKGEASNEYYDNLKKNLEHLGNVPIADKIRNRPLNCTTRTVGGYKKTSCL